MGDVKYIFLTKGKEMNLYKKKKHWWEEDDDFDQNMMEEKEDQNPYIFSKEMRNLLGEIESGNNYSKVNSEGGGFGALD